jgi:chromate transporter
MPGAMLATFGVVLPSFIIIFAISSFLESFLEIAWIAHAFWGIKIAVGILILDAALKMIKKMPKKTIQIGIFIATFAIIMLANILKLHLSSILVMLVAALISLTFFSIEKVREKRGQV